ncbi:MULTISPECIES: hypothetical protein [Acinetobacter]|jgi:hypothetical protein|uniref:hypothetical protein n=1 Tax=Acinetobacter TaxID=469 RepID=UPI000B3CAA4C|nr:MULTISPECIES: hypothetical protein [Acinetobacter]AXY60518.1 hypothetical protein CDG61_11080 [Acinetobacter sp. WCHAc010052]WOE40435.1 hypothetical protein QSG87_11045 [Acinetobacter chinensis]
MNSRHCQDAMLLHAINRILLKEWDPLGIKNRPFMRDEYEEYLPRIFELLCENAESSDIFEYLWRVETKVLELQGDKTHTLNIAKALKQLQAEHNLTQR